jgi:hypothetical protein
MEDPNSYNVDHGRLDEEEACCFVDGCQLQVSTKLNRWSARVAIREADGGETVQMCSVSIPWVKDYIHSNFNSIL